MSEASGPMLIFDLDGTLWDSAAQVAESWNIIFTRENPHVVPVTAEDIHNVMGMTMDEIRDALRVDVPAERRAEIFRECNTFEVEYLREHGGVPYPGLRPVMEELRRRGYVLAIVSNCQLGYIDAFLNASGMRDVFADSEEWEHTGLRKGENIRLVMERNGFPSAVYIGDTHKDEEAARLAGIPFIHAAYGFGRAEAPDAVIHSLRELPAVISRLYPEP